MHLPLLALLCILAPLALGAPTHSPFHFLNNPYPLSPFIPLITRSNTCALPTSSFSVLSFRSFDAALGPKGVSSISFSLTSNHSPAPITCECSMPAGSGLLAVDADRWIACKSDGSVKFDYGGQWLALSESYECMGKKVTAQGNATLSVFCYTEDDATFDGKTCLTPTGEIDIAITQVL